MDVMPWQAVVFISLPEAFLIILMGFTLIGIRPNLKRLGIVAAMQAVCSYFARALPYPFGVHMVLQLLTMVVLVKVLLGYRWRSVITGVFLGVAIFTGVIDAIYIPFVVRYVVPIQTIYSNPWVRIAVSMPEQVAMLGIILVCRKFNFKIINLSKYYKEVV